MKIQTAGVVTRILIVPNIENILSIHTTTYHNSPMDINPADVHIFLHMTSHQILFIFLVFQNHKNQYVIGMKCDFLDFGLTLTDSNL
jgi:hypothetical protein